MNRICQKCHARFRGIDDSGNPPVCGACGGPLVDDPAPDLDPPGATPQETDHRGILLPRRHAVGGVITPR